MKKNRLAEDRADEITLTFEQWTKKPHVSQHLLRKRECSGEKETVQNSAPDKFGMEK